MHQSCKRFLTKRCCLPEQKRSFYQPIYLPQPTKKDATSTTQLQLIGGKQGLSSQGTALDLYFGCCSGPFCLRSPSGPIRSGFFVSSKWPWQLGPRRQTRWGGFGGLNSLGFEMQTDLPIPKDKDLRKM